MPPASYPVPAGRIPSESPLPDGALGEICIRGENVFRGYLRDGIGLPRRGDWLCTGDLGVRSADGTFTFSGVVKPMFTRSGFNVYPREVEAAVLELRGVARAEVTAIPDAAKEHEIRLRYAGAPGEEDVRAWCAERLSAYKQPGVVERMSSHRAETRAD